MIYVAPFLYPLVQLLAVIAIVTGTLVPNIFFHEKLLRELSGEIVLTTEAPSHLPDPWF